MAYPGFDISRLHADEEHSEAAGPILETQHPLDTAIDADEIPEEFATFAASLVRARNQGGASLFLGDADLVAAGVAEHLIDLMRRGVITHLTVDLQGALHDWEFAHTGRICNRSPLGWSRSELAESFLAAVAEGDSSGTGLGEALGSALHDAAPDSVGHSLLAQGWEVGVPVTIHNTSGLTGLEFHSRFQPELFGRSLHRDLLVLANTVENLEQGALTAFGEACGVEALPTVWQMAAETARPYGRTISDFTIGIILPDIPFSSGPHLVPPSLTLEQPLPPGTRFELARAPLSGETEESPLSNQGDVFIGPYPETVPLLRYAALTSVGWEVPSSGTGNG